MRFSYAGRMRVLALCLLGAVGAGIPSQAGEPGGDALIVLRRYLDDRFTQGRQIYRLDLASGDAEPLVLDPAYTHSALDLDAAATRLVYQRFPAGQPDAEPEIWMLDLASGAQKQIASDAFLPAWAP